MSTTKTPTITTKGLLLFLFGCIVTRVAVGLVAMKFGDVSLRIGKHTNGQPPTLLQLLGGIYAVISVTMAVLYFTGWRTGAGPETFGGKIWWNDHRIVHATLYLLFAILALQRKKYAWTVLIVDAVYGLIVFLVHHYSK